MSSRLFLPFRITCRVNHRCGGRRKRGGGDGCCVGDGVVLPAGFGGGFRSGRSA